MSVIVVPWKPPVEMLVATVFVNPMGLPADAISMFATSFESFNTTALLLLEISRNEALIGAVCAIPSVTKFTVLPSIPVP